MIYFIADTHFGHENIIKHCDRPFNDVDEMDNTILENINKVVKPKDILWHLGDFAWHNPKNYVDNIRCNNIYILHGNHDVSNKRNLVKLHKDGHIRYHHYKYSSVICDLKWHGHKFKLCHYPLDSWESMQHGSIHLHGHTHGNSSKMNNRIDVGVDVTDYKPISILDVLDIV